MGATHNLDTIAGAGKGYKEWDDQNGRHLIRAYVAVAVVDKQRVELRPAFSAAVSERGYKQVGVATAATLSALTADADLALREVGIVELAYGQDGSAASWVNVVTRGEAVANIRVGTNVTVAAGDYIVVPVSNSTAYDTVLARAQTAATWADCITFGVALSAIAGSTVYTVSTGRVMLSGTRVAGTIRTIT